MTEFDSDHAHDMHTPAPAPMSDLVSQLVGALEHCEGVFMSHEINHINGGKIEDDALAIIRAALTAAKAGGWLPIETAPKDGTVVWVYNGEQGRMHWTAGDMPGGSWALWAWDDRVLADVDPEPYQPTHWQPLPTPPKEQA